MSGAGDCLVYSSWSDHLHAVQLDRGQPGDRPHTPLTLSQVTRANILMLRYAKADQR